MVATGNNLICYGNPLTSWSKLGLFCVALVAVVVTTVVEAQAPETICESTVANNDEDLIQLCTEHNYALEYLQQLTDKIGSRATELMAGSSAGSAEKRKNEFMRYGKRKNEFMRYGKRKNEFMRYGKRKNEFMRYGKRKNEFMRYGKRKNEFMRYGRAQ